MLNNFKLLTDGNKQLFIQETLKLVPLFLMAILFNLFLWFAWMVSAYAPTIFKDIGGYVLAVSIALSLYINLHEKEVADPILVSSNSGTRIFRYCCGDELECAGRLW